MEPLPPEESTDPRARAYKPEVGPDTFARLKQTFAGVREAERQTSRRLRLATKIVAILVPLLGLLGSAVGWLWRQYGKAEQVESNLAQYEQTNQREHSALRTESREDIRAVYRAVIYRERQQRLEAPVDGGRP